MVGNGELSSDLSTLAGHLMQAGIFNREFTGLLRCNVATGELARCANGEALRGFVQRNGKIIRQAEFSPIGVPTPMVVFQVASFATGQYYLHSINENLAEIKKGLGELKDMELSERAGKLEAIRNELFRIGCFTETKPEDISQCRGILREADSIRNDLRNQFNNKGEVWGDYKFYYTYNKELGIIKKALGESRIDVLLELAGLAENLVLSANLTLSCLYKDDKERHEFFKSSARYEFAEKYANRYHYLKGIVMGNANAIAQQIKGGETTINQIEDYFHNIERRFQKSYDPNIKYLYIEKGKIRQMGY